MVVATRDHAMWRRGFALGASRRRCRPTMTIADGAPPVIVDVPSGCMGFAEGCLQAVPDASCPIAFDIEETAIETCRANHPKTHAMCGDLLKPENLATLKARCIEAGVNVVIGGPPCQGFSSANTSKHERYEAMNGLPLVFVQFAIDVGAEIVIMEEVARFASKGALEEVIALLEYAGYRCVLGVLNAADFGAPQRRNRFVLIATKGGRAAPSLPRPTHAGRHTTFAQAMRARPVPARGPPISAEIAERVRQREQNKYTGGSAFTNSYGIIDLSKPSLTITTQFRNPGSGRFTLPCNQGHGLCRMSIEQAARLQGFPSKWTYAGTPMQQARQIGNGVPPALAKAVFGHVVRTHRGGG